MFVFIHLFMFVLLLGEVKKAKSPGREMAEKLKKVKIKNKQT